MKEIVEQDDTARLKEIVCPYCGAEHEPSELNLNLKEEEDLEIECENCAKKFTVSATFTVRYTTKRTICEYSKHEYELANIRSHENPYLYVGNNWTIYRCKHCHNEEILIGPAAADGKPYIQPLEVRK
jgi:DNA-directed RNA polymerase subunit RPC12/RpoP